MPSHISHALFAEDVIASVFGPDHFRRHLNAMTFGAQGPDLFYHTRRTRPSCVMFGSLIHKKGYGTLAANMARSVLTSQETIDSNSAAYLLGFTTHAFLDRKLHPYINYRAGWVEDGQADTEKYRHSHVFLERIIDVLLLREKKELLRRM